MNYKDLTINANEVIKGDIKSSLEEEIEKNVTEIKSIPESFYPEIVAAILHSITDGEGSADLNPFFTTFEGIDKKEAKYLALTQTKMAMADLNIIKLKKLGVKKFEWLHSNGDFCPEHLKLNGNIYSIDNPPIIDIATGKRGLPGEMPDCGCSVRPIVSFDY